MYIFSAIGHFGASRYPLNRLSPAICARVDSGSLRNNCVLWFLFTFFIISTSAHAESGSDMKHQMAQGKYIASMCTTCHQPDKSFEGIPPILGLSADKMYEMMMEYKDSVEHHEVMENIAKSLSKSEIRALAFYLASLKSHRRSM